MKKEIKSNFIKASSQFQSGHFDNVIRLLEPEIFHYRDNFAFFLMLGLSSLYMYNLESAESYLKRANQIDQENIRVLQGLAYIYVIRGKFDKALNIYLELVESDSKNKIAKLGLDFIRKNINSESVVGNKKITHLIPPIKIKRKKKKILFFFLVILIIISVILSNYFIFSGKTGRPGIAELTLPEKKPQLIDSTGNAQFQLSESEILKSFNKAKQYFNQYHDNLALVEINRLLNSNATRDVKNIVIALKKYVQQPDFSSFKDSFSFTVVQAEPVLYNGCFVIWRGKVGGRQIGESMITFDLWIGDENQFEGVIPVELDFAYDINNGKELEILGEIIFSDNRLVLKGITIHEILSKQ